MLQNHARQNCCRKNAKPVPIRKYDIPLSDVMPELHRKFADNSIRGQTNYEDMVKYFSTIKSKVEKEMDEEEKESVKTTEQREEVQNVNQRNREEEYNNRRRENLNSR